MIQTWWVSSHQGGAATWTTSRPKDWAVAGGEGDEVDAFEFVADVAALIGRSVMWIVRVVRFALISGSAPLNCEGRCHPRRSEKRLSEKWPANELVLTVGVYGVVEAD